MSWHEIVINILVSLGGLAGIGAFIKVFLFAKQERKSKEIENKSSEVDNLLKLVHELREEMRQDKAETHKYVGEFKARQMSLERKFENYKRATMEAYRCRFPEKIEECPVVHALNEMNMCDECKKKHEILNEEI